MKTFFREVSNLLGQTFGRRESRELIWIFAPLPPPVNGQARYNQEIVKYFSAHRPVVVLCTGSTSLAKLCRAPWLALVALFLIRRRDCVYTSPPGQNGLWLFLALIAVLRIRRLSHWVHHHSFRPINLGPLLSSRLLCNFGGSRQRHILLSHAMLDRYGDLYLTPTQRKNSRVLANSFIFSKRTITEAPVRSGPIVLGHLSVMTREKGVPYLLKLFRAVVASGIDCHLRLAGPISDPTLEEEVRATIDLLPGVVSWDGPVYGEALDEFYKKVDLFVFPSQLVDEADPLVLLEAYQRGCDVMASRTGCIPERVRSEEELLSFSETEDGAHLVARIRHLENTRYTEALACIAHGTQLHAESLEDARKLFAEFKIAVE